MDPIKFIQASDAHLNYRHYNLSERLADYTRAFRWLGEQVRKHNPDFVLFAGDLFDNPHPSNVTLTEAIEIIDDMNCPFLVVPGSHDASYNLSVGTVLDPLNAGGHIHYLPGHPYETDNVFVYGLPNYRTKEILDERIKEHYQQYPPLPKPDKFNIFLFHQAVQFPQMKLHPDEVDMNPQDLPSDFQYYGTGHLHFPVVLEMPQGGKFIQSPALETSDYANYDQPKGCYFVQVNKKGQIETDLLDYKKHREFQIFGENFSGETPSTITEKAVNLVKKHDKQGAILVLQLHGQLPHGASRSSVDYASIRESVTDALFLHILNKLEEPDILIQQEGIENLEKQAYHYFQEYFKSIFGEQAGDIASLANKLQLLYDDETLTKKLRAEKASQLINSTFKEVNPDHVDS